jgi:MFS family permease
MLIKMTGLKAIPQSGYRYVIVAVSFLILLIAFGIGYSFGTFFNDVREDLEWNSAITSLGYSISIVAGGIAGIFTGRLADKHGPRISIIITGTSLALGCLLMSFVHQPWQLYLFYGVLVGVGFGGAVTPLASTVSRWFTSYRGLMTGLVLSGTGFGTMIVPLFVNKLLQTYNWRTSFVIIAVIAAVLLLPAAFLLKRAPAQKTTKEISAASTSFHESGLSFNQAIHTGQMWLILVFYFLFGYCVHSVLLHIVPYAKNLKFDPTGAVAIMSFIGLGSIIGRIAMGTVSDKIGVKNTLIITIASMLAAFLWLQMPVQLWGLYVFGLVFGFAYGALIAMQTLVAVRTFGLLSLGTISGVITFSYTVGGALGPAATAYIFDKCNDYRPAYVITAVMALVALGLTLIIKRINGKII